MQPWIQHKKYLISWPSPVSPCEKMQIFHNLYDEKCLAKYGTQEIDLSDPKLLKGLIEYDR